MQRSTYETKDHHTNAKAMFLSNVAVMTLAFAVRENVREDSIASQLCFLEFSFNT